MLSLTDVNGRPIAGFGGTSPYGGATGSTRNYGYVSPASTPRPGPRPVQPGLTAQPAPQTTPSLVPDLGALGMHAPAQQQQGPPPQRTFNFNLGRSAGRAAGDALPGEAPAAGAGASGLAEGAELATAAL